MISENEKKLIDIRTKLASRELTAETIEETRGTNNRGHETVLQGKWKVGGLLFEYRIGEGRKYGAASVMDLDGQDEDFDLTGCQGVLRDIVFSLRHPETRRKQKESKENQT